MAEQRQVTIIPMDDGEYWVQSSVSFDSRVKNFNEARNGLEAMKKVGRIADFSEFSVRVMAITVDSEDAWTKVRDDIIDLISLGISGPESDIEIFDRGDSEPRQRFEVRSDSKGFRSLNEVQPANT